MWLPPKISRILLYTSIIHRMCYDRDSIDSTAAQGTTSRDLESLILVQGRCAEGGVTLVQDQRELPDLAPRIDRSPHLRLLGIARVARAQLITKPTRAPLTLPCTQVPRVRLYVHTRPTYFETPPQLTSRTPGWHLTLGQPTLMILIVS